MWARRPAQRRSVHGVKLRMMFVKREDIRATAWAKANDGTGHAAGASDDGNLVVKKTEHIMAPSFPAVSQKR